MPLQGAQSWVRYLTQGIYKQQQEKWDKPEVSNIKYFDGSWESEPNLTVINLLFHSNDLPVL